MDVWAALAAREIGATEDTEAATADTAATAAMTATAVTADTAAAEGVLLVSDEEHAVAAVAADTNYQCPTKHKKHFVRYKMFL